MQIENSLGELSDSIKPNNVYITGLSEEEEKEKEAKFYLEKIIAENFWKLGKKAEVQIL